MWYAEGADSLLLNVGITSTGRCESMADNAEEKVRGRPGPKPGTEAAKRGGRAAAAKYGHDFYSQIGKKGGTTVKARHGAEHYTRIGQIGGKSTKAKHGREHYVRIGKIGGQHKKKHAEEAREQ